MRAWVVALCLLSGLARADQPLPLYPGTTHTRIGNELVIDGEYYRIAYFTTADPPRKVATYFYRRWTEQGYPVTIDGDFRKEGVVSAFYTREGLQRSVVLTVHDGKTVGFSVLRDLWVKPEVKPASGLVQLEGTVVSQDLASRGDPQASQQRSALVRQGIVDTRNALVGKLLARGYRLVREKTIGADQSKRVVSLQRGPERVMATLVAVDPGMTALVESWTGLHAPGEKGGK